jgi:recombinational DNA repair protein RecR
MMTQLRVIDTMLDLYHQALALIGQWPGMGPLASQRMLEFFLRDVHTKKSLEKLERTLSSFYQCKECFLYIKNERSQCPNCTHKERNTLLVIASPLDYFACQQHNFFKNIRFFCLNGYVSPHQGKTIENTHLSRLFEVVDDEHQPCNIYLLFNQSLEARATSWLLQKKSISHFKIIDLSPLLMDKEFFYYLSVAEREHYVQALKEKMSPLLSEC